MVYSVVYGYIYIYGYSARMSGLVFPNFRGRFGGSLQVWGL